MRRLSNGRWRLDGGTVGERLRRQRHALALAVALADLSGEQPLEWVTATLSDFADTAMDEALRAAMLERVPDEEPRGLAILALGKLGSRELNYSSDVDLVLLFDPEPCHGARAMSRARRRCAMAGGSSSCCSSGPMTAMSRGSTCG